MIKDYDKYWEPLHCNKSYEISNLGNIRKIGNNKNIKLTYSFNPSKVQVCLDFNGNQKRKYYSRVVMSHKLKLNIDDHSWIVRYKDGNPHNINFNNLDLSTPTKRAQVFCNGTSHKLIKQIILTAKDMTLKEQSEKYNISVYAVGNIRSKYKVINDKVVKMRCWRLRER